ncbi:MAG: magnesium transporter [Clostridiaceae bacterium]|nr:magnesium transporter [Clostridiaceae bacterium]
MSVELEKKITDFRELLEKRDMHALREFLLPINEVDIALLIENTSREESALVFRLLPKEIAADVFANLPIENQQNLIEAFSEREVGEMINALYVDDAVDLLEEMPANFVQRILRQVGSGRREVINHFLRYEEDSAGSLMTAEMIHLRSEMTVGEAIQRVRDYGEYCEVINTGYVTLPDRVLEGYISLRTLLTSSDDELVGDLMETDVISARTGDDQEEVAHLFSRYDLLSLPVVDNENRLVGIITIDDVVDVIQEEATEDIEKMAAIVPSEESYLRTGAFTQARHRVGWLLFLMLSGILNGIILQHYEAAFLAMPILVSFVPMLTDTGGNAGSQSSTLVVRGLSLNEISTRDFWKVFWKEFQVSLLVSAVLGTVNFLQIGLRNDHNWMLALTVSLALTAIVILSKLVGGTLPLVAKKLRLDPAIMAAPLITTIVDAIGLIVYFAVATMLLQI